MGETTYEGTGKSQDYALQDLRKNAKADGYKDPLQITYRVSINLDDENFFGEFSKDYGIAFCSALEEAGISSTAVPEDGIEVTARGLYNKKKGVFGAGSCTTGSKTKDITDLF